MIAYACEGLTWGPRVRAHAICASIAGTVLGMGPRVRPPSCGSEAMPYRSVRWCEGSPFKGFDVAVGDPSVVALAPPEVFTVAVFIGGQVWQPACATEGRPPDAAWDAEAHPLHPWAGRVLPSRGEVRERHGWGAKPVVACLNPSWASGLLTSLARQGAQMSGVHVASVVDPADLVGADLAVVAAGWATTLEARACGVPYLSVDLHRRDHPHRANADPNAVVRVVAQIAHGAGLPDELRPHVPDWREAFKLFLRNLAEPLDTAVAMP